MEPESGAGNFHLIMNNDDASLSSDDDSRAREIEGNHRIAEALERTGLFSRTRPAPLTGVARIMSYVKTALFGCILVPPSGCYCHSYLFGYYFTLEVENLLEEENGSSASCHFKRSMDFAWLQ